MTTSQKEGATQIMKDLMDDGMPKDNSNEGDSDNNEGEE